MLVEWFHAGWTMIRAVIFDCFGVLVGTGYWNVYRRLGGDPDKDAAFLDEVLARADSGRITSAELAQIVSKHLAIPVEEYRRAHNADQVPNQEVFEFIRELKPRYKIGLLSNVGSDTIPRKIPPELLKLFDTVVISSEVGLLKPDPAIFRLAAERHGVRPEEAVFTDDHPEYLPGAVAIGMQAVLYKGLDDFRRQLDNLAAGGEP
jgi:epoxide hydrolase-like predicted phosphatase